MHKILYATHKKIGVYMVDFLLTICAKYGKICMYKKIIPELLNGYIERKKRA